MATSQKVAVTTELSDQEAYGMSAAAGKIRQALADTGYEPS
jgi:hypothetical protein